MDDGMDMICASRSFLFFCVFGVGLMVGKGFCVHVSTWLVFGTFGFGF